MWCSGNSPQDVSTHVPSTTLILTESRHTKRVNPFGACLVVHYMRLVFTASLTHHDSTTLFA